MLKQNIQKVGEIIPQQSREELVEKVRGFPIHRYTVALSYLKDLIQKKKLNRILDVGGFSDNEIIRKILPTNIEEISVNVPEEYHGRNGHITYDGKELPLGNESIPVVIAVDVLEHIPKELRLNFIQELLRVCQERVIISAPFGSWQNLKRESNFMGILKDFNLPPKKSFYEHKSFGLPKLKDFGSLGNIGGSSFRIEKATHAETDFSGLSGQVYALLDGPDKGIKEALKIAKRTEKLLAETKPKNWGEAYRAVLILDKD